MKKNKFQKIMCIVLVSALILSLLLPLVQMLF